MRRSLTTLARLATHPSLTAEAIATRVQLSAELRTRSIDAIVAPPLPRFPAAADDLDAIGLISEIVTTRIPGLRSKCLLRALVRFRMLRRRGHRAGFVMGIDPAVPDLEGHAWVELDGQPIYETSPVTCTVTLRSP